MDRDLFHFSSSKNDPQVNPGGPSASSVTPTLLAGPSSLFGTQFKNSPPKFPGNDLLNTQCSPGILNDKPAIPVDSRRPNVFSVSPSLFTEPSRVDDSCYWTQYSPPKLPVNHLLNTNAFPRIPNNISVIQVDSARTNAFSVNPTLLAGPSRDDNSHSLTQFKYSLPKLPINDLLKTQGSPSIPQDISLKRKTASPLTSSASTKRQTLAPTALTSSLIGSSTDQTTNLQIPSSLPSPSSKYQPSNVSSIPACAPILAPLEKTPEICLSHIWNFCRIGDKCSDIHYHLPYRWQVYDGSKWGDLPDMEDVERAYSEPGNDSFQEINFQTMRTNNKPVRRLSTPSSITRPPQYVLTTQWIWYWKDENAIWVEYGYSNMQNIKSSQSSPDLEQMYIQNPTGSVTFTAGTNSYIIHLQEMKQKNSLLNTEKEVRRRPKFLDYKNVQILKGCTKGSAANVKQFLSSAKEVETRNQKILVPESSSEFSKIVKLFQKTLSMHVKRLWRIKNSYLWEVYQLQRKEMKRRNSGKNVDERFLFHGTGSANINSICNMNFDWRVCGTNGTVFGQGSYFARDASYSHTYCSVSSCDTRAMFVARVLVGEFVAGDSTMKLPPQKPNSTERYDSCVDNVLHPSIFVVFDKLQVYPEYILEY